MIVYENGEQFNVPTKWLADHDKQIRDEVIGDVLTVLKAMHMARTCEDDYVARIEAPFYRELFAKIKQMKGEQNE